MSALNAIHGPGATIEGTSVLASCGSVDDATLGIPVEISICQFPVVANPTIRRLTDSRPTGECAAATDATECGVEGSAAAALRHRTGRELRSPLRWRRRRRAIPCVR